MATQFYVVTLGLTRDPYLMVGTDNMWVNVGRQQFHLPTGAATLFPGTIGLVLPDLAALRVRLEAARTTLAHTEFRFSPVDDHVEVTCPWGNRINCHAPDQGRFGRTGLGIAYLEIPVPTGALQAVARFYAEIMGLQIDHIEMGSNPSVDVHVGMRQRLRLYESREASLPVGGRHLQLFVADFAGLWEELQTRDKVTVESNPWQFFFTDIFDEAGNVVFQLNHEIRSLTHPMYGRPLINRNPALSSGDYRPGHDAIAYTVPPDPPQAR